MRRPMILTAMLLGLAPAATAQTPPPIDPILAERKANLPKARPWPIAWFQPQELVRGAMRQRSKPVVTGRSIDRAALKAARDYAMSKDTQAFLVWRDGKYEMAEFANGTKPADMLNSYYMHYPVLALLYGIAIREGKIGSIEDPIGNYIPEWAGDDRGKITLRQMLNMAAGLEVYFDDPNPRTKAARLFMGGDSTAAALEYGLRGPPGQEFAYNYLVPEILGIALSRAIGMRYADYLSSRLWRPMGNADAAVWLDRPGGRPHFNSALFATAEDWLNVGKLIMNEGRVGKRQIVPASWIKTMKTPSSVNPNFGMLWLGTPYVADRKFIRFHDPRYTYHVESSAPYKANDLIFLDGYGAQRVYMVPSKKLIIVRIGQSRKDWDDSMIPNLILGGLR